MHYYAGNPENDTASYLASALLFDRYVDTLEGTLRYVKAKGRSKHDVYLSRSRKYPGQSREAFNW